MHDFEGYSLLAQQACCTVGRRVAPGKGKWLPQAQRRTPVPKDQRAALLSGGRGFSSGNFQSPPRSLASCFTLHWAFSPALCFLLHRFFLGRAGVKINSKQSCYVEKPAVSVLHSQERFAVKPVLRKFPIIHRYHCFHQYRWQEREGGSWEEANAVALTLERGEVRQRLA